MSNFRLPSGLHGGGYRPVGGYASSERKVSDLPPPPKGPGGGSKPFTKRSLKRYKALCDIIETLPVYPPTVIIPGRTRLPSGRKSDLVYVEVISTDTGLKRRYYFDHTPSRDEVHGVIRLMIEVLNGAF